MTKLNGSLNAWAPVLFLLASVAMLGSSSHLATAQSKDVKVPSLSPEAQAGNRAFDKYCAECHGKNAAGTDKGPTFMHRVYHPGHHADRAFPLAVRGGVKRHHWRFGDMKPVPGVSDNEIPAIIRYVRELQKANGIF